MVAVGDIIEISDAKSKEKAFPKVSLLGRRYEVKGIDSASTATFPALKATPLNYEYTDKKGKFFPTSPLYNPQADGSTWESSGLSHKGRTRSIKPNTYFVVQSPTALSPPSTPSPTPSPSPSSTSISDSPSAPIFGMAGATQEESPKEEVKDDLPVADLSSKSSSVEEQIELAARLFNNIGVRSNKHFQPYANDRELDYEKFSNYRIRLDEDNAKGMSVRVIFSSPIEEEVAKLSAMNETDFFKMLTNSRTGIVRQYTIGEPVQDVVNRSGKILPLQYFTNGAKWDNGGKVIGITMDFAPVITETSSTPESESDEISPREDKEGFEGLGSLFGAEAMDGLNTYPRLTINLEGADGKEFSLIHTYQGDIKVSFPEEEKDEVVEVTSPATFAFGGQAVSDIEVGSSDSEKPELSLNWDDIVMIPNYSFDYNRFPSTVKNADGGDYDIRAVLGIDFNHDHPVFRPYEKPYVVDWDNAPSIMGSSATGYIEAIFTVSAPNLPEGSVTDRLPGYFGESNPPYNPNWMDYPRKVSVILPKADSLYMDIPSDGDSEHNLDKCDEIKYYQHKGKYRDIQLVGRKKIDTKFNMKTLQNDNTYADLTATWKVGEDYEFETKKIGASGYQKFKGELTGLIVRPDESREPAFKSATQSRRDRRLQATMEKDSADIFYGKNEADKKGKSFIIVLKNEKNTPYSGQIVRIKLGGDE
ncbi:MAG: hypothetical protein CML44_00235 [Rhodobacteraceae bacterium]|nr:hypothetical protein [Paracoccaceae bacterium]|tara:strand:- start:13623 stop:15728 length:2106 start_codon:yes stop_codon:yes gene_type:complete